MSTQRFQYKSGQNAHGSTSEVALWFLVRRLDVDWGLGRDQTNAAYVFEHCSRATLRQHLSEEPFRTEGWELGISEIRQYRRTAPISRAKRTFSIFIRRCQTGRVFVRVVFEVLRPNVVG